MTDIKRKLASNIKHVTERIACACVDARREPREVTLVAVTKYVGLDVIRLLPELGVTNLGENRVQSLTARAESLAAERARPDAGSTATPVRWHMVGHLQRNKVKPLLAWVDMIQSLDSLRLAEEIDAHARQANRVMDVLMQVNVSQEKTKNGVAVGAATHLAESIATLPNLRLCGLMAMGPLTPDRDAVRAAFVRCKELFDEIAHDIPVGDAFDQLSMGMSDDFELGIATGATTVRIGRALFDGVGEPVKSQPSQTA